MARHRSKKGKRSQAQAISTAVILPREKPKDIIDAPEPTHTEPPKTLGESKHVLRWVLVGAGGLCLMLVGIWAAGNFFSSRFSLAGTVISGHTSEAAIEQLVVTKAARYHLNVLYPDGKTKSFALQDIGVYVNPVQTVATSRAMARSWPQMLMWWRAVPLHVQANIDSAAFKTFITNDTNIVTLSAHNAEISITGGAVQIAKQTPGKRYGLSDPAQAVLAAVGQLQTTPLRLLAKPLEPGITAAALASAKTQLETILHQHIIIAMSDQTITPSADDIANWVSVTPNTNTVHVGVNEDGIRQYLNNLASNHAQSARSQIVLDTTGTVLQAGARGIAVGDTSGASDIIAQSLLRGSGIQVSLPVQLTDFQTVQAPTTGKWIEVNTTTKRMYVYDQGQLVRSFLVSAGKASTPTVIGRFAIYAKYRSQDMAGENADGSNYFQPAVPYVNYFYHDYAIHGNYWRPASYFGNINSSHGCVGVTVSDGSWIYSWAPIGTPVIVHT